MLRGEYLKGKTNKTVVRPVAIYRAECCPKTWKHEQALHTMKTKILRRILVLTRFDYVERKEKELLLNYLHSGMPFKVFGKNKRALGI